MTPLEKLQADLDDARRQLSLPLSKHERKFWKSRVHELTDRLLEEKGLMTRTYEDRFSPGVGEIQT